MAKFFFTYATMAAGKSFEIIKVAFNYREQGKPVLVMNSSLDTRGGRGFVWSRAGFKTPAQLYGKECKIKDILYKEAQKPQCILIDEAQFLTKEQVLELVDIVDEEGITVMCFGLKNDSFNNLFEGSKNLLIFADNISELKTECWFCNKKAVMTLRFDEDGSPLYTGEQIEIGGNERFLPVCRVCHKNPWSMSESSNNEEKRSF